MAFPNKMNDVILVMILVKLLYMTWLHGIFLQGYKREQMYLASQGKMLFINLPQDIHRYPYLAV